MGESCCDGEISSRRGTGVGGGGGVAEVVFVETFFLGGGIGLVQGEEGGAEDFWGRRKRRKRVSEVSLG